MSIVAAQITAVHPDPSGHYDGEGNLSIALDPSLGESPLAPLVRFTLTAELPAEAFHWEPGGGGLFVRWQDARRAERRLRGLWPEARVTAAANPGYGQRAAQLLGAGR